MKSSLIASALVALVVSGLVLALTPKTEPRVTAISSPDIQSPYFSVGGVRTWAGRTDSLIQASTTVCAIQSPSATSTLIGGGIRFTTATSTAIVIDIAKSLTPAATTTKIGSTYSLAGNIPLTLVASTTGVGPGDATVFGPNQWFVVKMDNGGGSANNAPSGTCQAVWHAF